MIVIPSGLQNLRRECFRYIADWRSFLSTSAARRRRSEVRAASARRGAGVAEPLAICNETDSCLILITTGDTLSQFLIELIKNNETQDIPYATN
ncbi:unnamed protein product [Euphydryas editha]|uniref:Uncharacterized protein n=1 Tax=Euphydryas editha TaxID=104508 RepID=A0AAU9U469_EUPED|nr:unnamed protein product [Euphydryas editha]